MSSDPYGKNVDDLVKSLMDEFERKDIPMNMAIHAMLKISAMVMGAQKLEQISFAVDDFRKMCLLAYERLSEFKEEFDTIMENRNEPK